ncbi:MAG: hypothetical protein E7231_04140 [Cellulosilyticum sp.]|nr:hypothetical protein [Cellulosilyticum sp.]
MAEGFTKWAKEEKNRKYVVVIAGVVLVAIGITFWPSNQNGNQSSPVTTTIKQAVTNDEDDYEAVIEKKLTNMLAKMEGVGSVNVMVTVKANEEKILAEDTSSSTQRTEEKDQAGGTRVTDHTQQTEDVVLQNGNTPYVIKEYAPEIRGVFILAEGAGDSLVKNQITDAVSKLLDVPVHKISVEKKKN